MVFRYPGGKTKLLPLIYPFLEKRILTSYHDVFVGGGSVLIEMAKKNPNVLLRANDLDQYIFSFWKVLTENDTSFERFIGFLDCKPTLEMFLDLRNRLPDTLEEKAFYAVFFNRCTFSGIFSAGPIGGMSQKSEWKVDCRYNKDKLIKDSIYLRALFKDRLIVTNLDFEEYLHQMIKGLIYLDPPYYEKGEDLYNVFMTKEKHVLLSEILKTTENWVLSYDDNEKIRELYSSENIQELKTKYCINGTKKDWKNKLELLITAGGKPHKAFPSR